MAHTVNVIVRVKQIASPVSQTDARARVVRRRVMWHGGATAMLIAALYVLAVGTVAGRRLDKQLATPLTEQLGGPAGRIVESFGIWTALAATASLLLFALWHRGVRTAIVLGIALAGAVGSARLVEAALERTDPLRGEFARALGGGFFPSGHSTAIMALVLAAGVTARSRRTRRAIVLVGGGGAGVVGVSHVAASSHLPSDVIAGFLLAMSWIGIAAFVLVGRSCSVTPMPYTRLMVTAAAVLVLIAVACLAANSGAGWVPLAGAAAVTATAVWLVAALVTALGAAEGGAGRPG